MTFYAIYYQTDYYYTGDVQVFTAPTTGWYRMELYGAQGGSDTEPGGNGGYVRGETYITAGTSLYVYVGPKGPDWSDWRSPGYNGGGATGSQGSSGAGGGATSVSTVRGNGSSGWRNASVLNNRIIVAGAGGGGTWFDNGKDGGQMYPSGGGGPFGYGASGYADYDSNWPYPDSGGGGGGYYGGYGGCGAYEGAGGGSSFVSGYGSCPTVQGYTFRSVTYSVGSNNVSSLGGNGYCRIILVGT